MSQHDPIDALTTERDLPGDRHRQIRELVMNQIDQDVRPARRGVPRRWVLAGAALAVVAAVGAGAVTLAGGGQDPAPGAAPPMTEVATIFENAAVRAQAAAFTPPRPDQWIYIETLVSSTGPVARAKGMRPESRLRSWFKADGTHTAFADGDEPAGLDRMVYGFWPKLDYPSVAGLPTDPVALLAKLKADAATATAGTPYANEDPDVVAFASVVTILGEQLPPPDVAAALFRSLALIPGAMQKPVEMDGRRLIVLSRDSAEFPTLNSIMLDAETFAFVGTREEYKRDEIIDFDGGVPVKKGEIETITMRGASGIVDNYGDTP